MPPQRISSHRCNVCFARKARTNCEDLDTKTTPENLKLCSGCKLISYCSTEHQKYDWQIHMKFCRAIQSILKSRPIKCDDPNFKSAEFVHEFPSGPIKTKKQFQLAIWKIQYILMKILDRRLHYYEHEMLSFPRMCQGCFSFKTNSKYICTDCQEVTYCSNECQLKDIQAHAKVCNKLKIFYNFYDLHEVSLQMSEKYLHLDLQKLDLFEYLQFFAGVRIPKKPATLREYQFFSAVCTYSYVCTILKAVHFLYLQPRKSEVLEDTYYTIFIVGAKNEMMYFKEDHCKFLMSQLPNIKKLKINFIGPELAINLDISVHYEFEFEVAECKRKFKEDDTFSVEALQKDFRYRNIPGSGGVQSTKRNSNFFNTKSTSFVGEFEKKSNSSEVNFQSVPLTEKREISLVYRRQYLEDLMDKVSVANIILCFNSGFSEFEFNSEKHTWSNAINAFMNLKIPIVFTSYSKNEAQNDMKIIFDYFGGKPCKDSFSMLQTPDFNNMGDFRPLRNPEYADEDQIYHMNGYFTAVMSETNDFSWNTRLRSQ